jgi:SAM-dependent methyltransferase
MSELARSFGSVAEAYDRGRPRYPREVVAEIAQAAGRGPRLLDVGAGTGRLSLPLVEAGYDVVAVEPLAGMRAILARDIGAERVLDGRAEALPLPDASVDGAVCSDAWHWFDGPRAADELQRVVRSGGGVVVCVLLLDDNAPTPAWAGEIEALLRPLWEAAGHPARLDPKPAEGLDGHPGFTPVQIRNVPMTHRTDREGMLAHFLSMSVIASMDDARREQVLGELDAVLERHGLDEIDISYRAQLSITRRRRDPALRAGPRAAAS